MPTISDNHIAAISIRSEIKHCYKRGIVSYSFHSTKLFGKLTRQLVKLLSEMDSSYCIFCTNEVTSCEEALLCDGCNRWQHRCCETGITRDQFRSAVRSGIEVIWRCLYCSDNSADYSLPVAESTPVGFVIPVSFADSISVNQEAGIAILWFVVREGQCYI